MDYIQSLRDSVETSVSLKLFSSQKIAAEHHVFNTTYQIVSMSDCKTLENIADTRFSSDPYPAHDRPRGQKDLDSVKYHRRIIRKTGQTEPIWIAKKGDRYIMLDGVHRIVASNMENKRQIPAFIVHLDS
jgi:hypothetical protein